LRSVPNSIHLKSGLKAKTSLLEPVDNTENPFAGLNVGLIDIENKENESKVTLRLVSYQDDYQNKYKDFFTSKLL